jgi:glycopeptide antibiotics resistance protein
VKQFSKLLLAAYFLFLLWLILFKTSSDVFSVLAHYQSRSVNLIPFAGFSSGTVREMLDNFIVFVPLGLLLGVCFKHAGLRRNIAFIFLFSVSVEIVQFVLAIGVTDITDVIANTLGGLLGLAAYGLAGKHIDNQKLDWFITVILAILLLAFLWLRFMVLRVRY